VEPAKLSFGTPHHHYRLTDSTNARARELAEAGAPGGLVVTASEQEAGRGRQGRSWFAPQSGAALLYSALLRPLGERPLLPLAAPLAVCDAAESLAGVDCAVKWPNDVWVEGRKLSGVLIESRFERGGGGWAVIGVGLNLSIATEEFPAELRGTATSLSLASGDEGPTPVQARHALDLALGRWLEKPAQAVLDGFRERDALAGRLISWDGGSGSAAGIDDSGHLLVDLDDGSQRALGAGEVHLSVAEEA
jgi:BirA family transcriptional regulator, biotin operon repressor / biotin---[acetyl-CoA-carboxylase] ligase